MKSAGLSLNLARATPRHRNTPEFWAGFSNTVSFSKKGIKFPVPSGASLFWNETFVGLEMSWGVGSGFAWTRPLFTPVIGRFRADRGTVEALARGELLRALTGSFRFEK